MKIPETKTDAVDRALREAFGASEMDEIRTMTAGLSKALVFRIVVQGNPYLLRVIMNTDVAAGLARRSTHHFAAMAIAAQAGIGPRVWYTSTEDGVSITDFVAAHCFTNRLVPLPATLRKLHALPAFPSARVVNPFDAADKLADSGWQFCPAAMPRNLQGILLVHVKDVHSA